MKKLLKSIIFIGAGLVSSQVFAVNLMQAYQQAVVSDPTFQIAHSQWFADREQIAISRSELLPSFDITGSYGRTVTHNTSNPYNESLGFTTPFYNDVSIYDLTLDQPIFNYQAWAQLKQAKASVKSSAANFMAAAQSLIFRTAEAYLSVLQAGDVLRYTEAEKRATASELARTTERFKVGLATITDVHQARSSYDTAVAEEINERNNLDIQKEKLREITGQHYKYFAKLSKKLPLVSPHPANIQQWVNKAQQQNYDLSAARYQLVAAQENIRAQAGARYPVLTAEGNFNQRFDGNIFGSSLDNTLTNGGLSLKLDFPVIQGGLVNAKTRQASYNYQKASSNLEKTDRTVISNTRQAYLSVISGISQVQANKQAVISARSSLESTQEAYKVGTSTMIDVLAELSRLYDAERAYATSQYNYLIQSLVLKQAAGILSVNDIHIINSWLEHEPKYVNKQQHKPTPKPTPKKMLPQHTCRVANVIEKQLLAINAKHYTIQLTTGRDSKNIMTFVNKHPLSEKVYIFSSYVNGKNIYKLILGNYATLAQAHKALHKLSAEIHAKHPWIRTYAGVQREIKESLCK